MSSRSWLPLVLVAIPIGAAILVSGPGRWYGIVHVDPVVRWLVLAVCLLVVFVLLGWAVNGVWWGIFVGKNTNTWSLSITQALLWTTIILPAVLAISLDRMYHGSDDPLRILIDSEFYIFMGLPVASFTTAAAITGGKLRGKRTITDLEGENLDYLNKYLGSFSADYSKATDTRPEEIAGVRAAVAKELEKGPRDRPRTMKALERNVQASGPASHKGDFLKHIKSYLEDSVQGVVRVNRDPTEARPTDMLSGTEVGDASSTDFARVQYFIISILAMAVYVAALVRFLGAEGGICSDAVVDCALPSAQGAFAGMLLISTLGYLGMKGAPATRTT